MHSASKARSKRGKWQDFVLGAKAVVLGTRMNLLLLCFPLAVASEVAKVDAATFVFSLLALVPLAERLGFVTEELAMHTNDTLGGLLNATFGNATELIICAVSLYKASSNDSGHTYLRIVQLSLLGSILGNLLLVLGTAFLIGGLAHPRQSFNREGMGVNSGMLIVAVAGILLPSTLEMTDTGVKRRSALHLSRFESIVMLILYALYLVFQLITHKHLYEQGNEEDERTTLEAPPRLSSEQNGHAEHSGVASRQPSMDGTAPRMSMEAEKGNYLGHAPAALHRTRTQIQREEEGLRFLELNDGAEEDEEGMSLSLCLAWLAVITGLIAFLSEMVVGTIEDAHDTLGIPMPFLSTIVLPTVGNAAEHASAILFAYKNKMDITLGVAVGSSTQIAVLVIPFTVVLGWIMGQELDLDFEWFEGFTLFLCVMVTIIAVTDGSSSWIKGLLLLVTYVFTAAAFWVHSDSHLSGNNVENGATNAIFVETS